MIHEEYKIRHYVHARSCSRSWIYQDILVKVSYISRRKTKWIGRGSRAMRLSRPI